MSQHECIVCGDMHDPERAEQAERALGEARKPCGICGDHDVRLHCLHCGRHLAHLDAPSYDTLRATLARVERDLTIEMSAHEESNRANANHLDTLTAERDGLRDRVAGQEWMEAQYRAIIQEKEGLQASLDRDKIEAAVWNAVQLITMNPAGKFEEDWDSFAASCMDIGAFVETITNHVMAALGRPVNLNLSEPPSDHVDCDRDDDADDRRPPKQ